jgi:hypothetical protein
MKTKICSNCKKEKLINEFYKRKDSNSKFRSQCKECFRIYLEINKGEIKKRHHTYYLTHREKIKKQVHTYYIKNKKIIFKKAAIYINKRSKIDLNFKLKNNLRKRIWDALRGDFKSEHTMELIGCSIEFLKKHLTKHFKLGMSWQNYGAGWNGKGMKEWHVDHIKPCANFDLSKPEEQRKCFNYTNLQPLWAKENIKKDDK